MKDDLVYIPNEFVENMSCEALGFGGYLIACKSQPIVSFAQIAKANRGSLKKLPGLMEEFIAKGFAELIHEGMWRFTIPQPDGQMQILVSEEEHVLC